MRGLLLAAVLGGLLGIQLGLMGFSFMAIQYWMVLVNVLLLMTVAAAS